MQKKPEMLIKAQRDRDFFQKEMSNLKHYINSTKIPTLIPTLLLRCRISYFVETVTVSVTRPRLGSNFVPNLEFLRYFLRYSYAAHVLQGMVSRLELEL